MTELSTEVLLKYEKLKEHLKQQGNMGIAFSGGVDSTLLLKVAKEVLGEKVTAITVKSFSFPERERKEAEAFCQREGIRHRLMEFDEFEIAGFAGNPPDRCYLCKKALFGKILLLAKEDKLGNVAEGSNVDDDGDYRPGMRAVRELGVLSPLKEAGFHKREVRELSKWLGLSSWNKPSAACLSTRFVYGEKITKEKLEMADRAEQFLMDLGFHQLRVRIHGEGLARIEVSPDELEAAWKKRSEITSVLKKIGFYYVTLDLEGYRTGSMNEVLNG